MGPYKKLRFKHIVFALACVFLLTAAGRYYLLRTGTGYHPPVLYHIPTGSITYIDIYGVDEERPWELAEYDDGGTFALPELQSRVWESAYIWEDISGGYGGAVLPNRWCYLILDLWEPEQIQVHPIREGAFSIREYNLKIEEKGGGFVVWVN